MPLTCASPFSSFSNYSDGGLAVYILPSSIDWQGLWDLEVVQAVLRGLKVVQNVELAVLAYMRLPVT